MESHPVFLPKERFKEMAAHGHIRCVEGQSPFGAAAVALLDGRVIFLGFGDCRGEVLRRFGLDAAFETDDALIRDVFSHPERYRSSMTLFGTPFQMTVWKKLLEIPFGATVSYSDLAFMIRAPKSLRAVASAVGQNPVAYLVPCHRVVPKDGSTGGYHYGSHIKELLLMAESI